MKNRRKVAYAEGDRSLEMQLNHDIDSLIKQREIIEDAYNKAKLQITRNGIVIIESNAGFLSFLFILAEINLIFFTKKVIKKLKSNILYYKNFFKRRRSLNFII